MRSIWSTLWLRNASVSEQMANKTNLWAEESWAVRTRNGGGSGWCGSAFSKFPSQLSSVFLLVWHTLLSRLITSHHLSPSYARYSCQLEAIPKDFIETFRVSLKSFFWLPWERMRTDSLLLNCFFESLWFFMQTTWPTQQSCDCIKMV